MAIDPLAAVAPGAATDSVREMSGTVDAPCAAALGSAGAVSDSVGLTPSWCSSRGARTVALPASPGGAVAAAPCSSARPMRMGAVGASGIPRSSMRSCAVSSGPWGGARSPVLLNLRLEPTPIPPSPRGCRSARRASAVPGAMCVGIEAPSAARRFGRSRVAIFLCRCTCAARPVEPSIRWGCALDLSRQVESQVP